MGPYSCFTSFLWSKHGIKSQGTALKPPTPFSLLDNFEHFLWLTSNGLLFRGFCILSYLRNFKIYLCFLGGIFIIINYYYYYCCYYCYYYYFTLFIFLLCFLWNWQVSRRAPWPLWTTGTLPIQLETQYIVWDIHVFCWFLLTKRNYQMKDLFCPGIKRVSFNTSLLEAFWLHPDVSWEISTLYLSVKLAPNLLHVKLAPCGATMWILDLFGHLGIHLLTLEDLSSCGTLMKWHISVRAELSYFMPVHEQREKSEILQLCLVRVRDGTL